ncbi:MAG: DUF5008 domain-containing protein [Ginsengibacter sp.]
MINIKRNIRLLFLMVLALSVLPVLFFSCSKLKLEPVETYPPGPKPLVKFLDGAPVPAQGVEGSIVTFKVSGLGGKDTSQFKFFINQTLAQVVEVDSASVKVKIPANASTGGSSVLINGEVYFGPNFMVKGKISIDPNFNPDVNRTNGTIYGVFQNSSNNYLIYGSFTNYGNSASVSNTITGLAELDGNGNYLTNGGNGTIQLGKQGLNGSVLSVVQLPSSDYIIAGSFSQYDTIRNVNNITQIQSSGALETMIVDIENPDPINQPDANKDTVPYFNGGVSGGIVKAFYDDSRGSITAVGNFSNYSSTFYERSVKGGPFLDFAKMRQLVRMNEDGSLDSTFNYNPATQSGYDVGNGFIFDAMQLPDGRIIVVGNFTTFDGQVVNYITRINTADGSVDPTFNMGGSGADKSISHISYNANTGKILLTGNFKNYNGQPANGVVMIDQNGAIDPSFTFRKVDAGIANFAGQLDNGMIIVSGSFNKYDNIVRPGLLILNPDGSLASGYNNTGLFRGAINGFTELTSSTTGEHQVILVGNFDRFDGIQVGNIVKFTLGN